MMLLGMFDGVWRGPYITPPLNVSTHFIQACNGAARAENDMRMPWLSSISRGRLHRSLWYN